MMSSNESPWIKGGVECEDDMFCCACVGGVYEGGMAAGISGGSSSSASFSIARVCLPSRTDGGTKRNETGSSSSGSVLWMGYGRQKEEVTLDDEGMFC